jgi:hypothetical protein
MVHAARASAARATAPPSTRHLLIGSTAIKIARNSPENNALNFSNRSKRASLRPPFSHVLRPEIHDSRGTHHASRSTNHQPLLTNHAFLIATRPELKIKPTRSQQTRKLFLIATFSGVSWHRQTILPVLFGVELLRTQTCGGYANRDDANAPGPFHAGYRARDLFARDPGRAASRSRERREAFISTQMDPSSGSGATGINKSELKIRKKWSGRGDLNSRPPAPKAGALPGCATPRQ